MYTCILIVMKPFTGLTLMTDKHVERMLVDLLKLIWQNKATEEVSW